MQKLVAVLHRPLVASVTRTAEVRGMACLQTYQTSSMKGNFHVLFKAGQFLSAHFELCLTKHGEECIDSGEHRVRRSLALGGQG